MPVPGFLSSFADKAQYAIQGSSLVAHLPTHARPQSPDDTQQPSEAAAQGGHRSHALDTLHHQIRAFGQQYSNTTPVQKIITTEKGVAIDFESVSRDAKAQSKELYTWGQSEADDLKDVTDRLAYLNFVQGSLASSLSSKLDAARAPLKALRDAEAALAPRRALRVNLQNQAARLEHDQQRGNERKIADLRDQIRKAELEDQAQEREVDILKRRAVRESEQLKWEAIREYGEKLVLLSQAAPPITAVLPSIPPTPNQPYTGTQTTAAVRASLQRALDNYKTGHINLPPQLAGADLSRSDTRSFGESHASELSSIRSDITGSTHLGNVPMPSPGAKYPAQVSPSQPSSVAPLPEKIQSPPINPQALNHSPAPIPPVTSSISPPPLVAPDPTKPTVTVPVITPTVAETGVPVSAGADGPGPASGSLHDIKGASSAAGPRSGGLPADEARVTPYGQSPTAPAPAAIYESAEEKRRLQASYSQAGGPHWEPLGGAVGGNTSGPRFESAEDEKKRLEREERERILREGGSHQQRDNNGGADAPPKKDEELPPYQDI